MNQKITLILALVSETPAKLEGLNIVGRSSTSVTLSWTRPKTPIMLPVTSYRLIIKDTKTNIKWEKDASGTISRFTVDELKPKSTYYISIYAINKEGNGQISSFPVAETLEESITPGRLSLIIKWIIIDIFFILKACVGFIYNKP